MKSSHIVKSQGGPEREIERDRGGQDCSSTSTGTQCVPEILRSGLALHARSVLVSLFCCVLGPYYLHCTRFPSTHHHAADPSCPPGGPSASDLTTGVCGCVRACVRVCVIMHKNFEKHIHTHILRARVAPSKNVY
jgi:hypothetical protein